MTAARALLSWRPPAIEGKVPAAYLSKRQADVLTGYCHGLANQRIATALGLSEDTVKTHGKAVLRALHANGRAHAVSLVTSGAVTVYVKKDSR